MWFKLATDGSVCSPRKHKSLVAWKKREKKKRENLQVIRMRAHGGYLTRRIHIDYFFSCNMHREPKWYSAYSPTHLSPECTLHLHENESMRLVCDGGGAHAVAHNSCCTQWLSKEWRWIKCNSIKLIRMSQYHSTAWAAARMDESPPSSGCTALKLLHALCSSNQEMEPLLQSLPQLRSGGTKGTKCGSSGIRIHQPSR